MSKELTFSRVAQGGDEREEVWYNTAIFLAAEVEISTISTLFQAVPVPATVKGSPSN